MVPINSALKVLLASLLALAAAAHSAQASVSLVSVSPDSEATCSRGDAWCVAALSVTGNAHCEKATCVAVSVLGDARAGCYGEGCLTGCGSFGDACGVTKCEGDLALACAALAVSVLGHAEAYTYCRWFGQACVGVSLSSGYVLVIYCTGDFYDTASCQVTRI